MKISLYTSGSTGKQKLVTHAENDFYKAGHWLVEKWGIGYDDVIINPFPTWTIASWAFCIIPAKIAHCNLVNIKFEPLKFWDVVEEVKPTVLTLAMRTLHTMLSREMPDLSYMKNLSTGSAPVSGHLMNLMNTTGAQNCWNIYGSSECIPPVLMTKKETFDFRDTPYYLEYSDSLIVDGYDTFDKFEDGKCLERPNLNETWKSK